MASVTIVKDGSDENEAWPGGVARPRSPPGGEKKRVEIEEVDPQMTQARRSNRLSQADKVKNIVDLSKLLINKYLEFYNFYAKWILIFLVLSICVRLRHLRIDLTPFIAAIGDR